MTRKQAGLTGLYLGLIATVWFSVPKADGVLRALLVVGSVAALVTAVCGAVVGAHFFPLVRVLRDPRLRPLGIVVCAVAAAGLVAGVATSVAPGLVVGIGTGTALLGYAVITLVGAWRTG